jgi:tetratricopeptide (TPR) repeat protein
MTASGISAPGWLRPWLAAAVITAAAAVAYHAVPGLPFVFDDAGAVTQNQTIRRLWPLTGVLSGPADGTTSSGRPLVNLSLAVNYAISGEAAWSYHLANLAIHVLAGLALSGIVRRTLLLRTPVPNAAAAGPIALAVALLWTVHPLQTESVTCVAQRTESLMGLLFLLTVYAFVRSVDSPRPRAWLGASFAACLLGMAAKEVMVAAPLLVLLYDRTFVAGKFRDAWRRRRVYYLGLAGTWLLLAWLVIGGGGSRGTAAGIGLGVSVWSYALTQCHAILLYLKLSFWPHPLNVDYGTGVAAGLAEVWPQAVVLLGLLAATVWALVCRPAAGFLGAWFFLILAPSSSVVPLVEQTVAEHRMYLPLAAVLVAVVFALHRWFGRWWWPAGLALAVAWIALTMRRNEVYRSELSLWTDTVAQAPGNARAHYNLGFALARAGRLPEAVPEYEAALRLKPAYAEAHNNLGNALAHAGREAEARVHYEAALRANPRFGDAHYNLADALMAAGEPGPAATHYAEAVRLQPDPMRAQAGLAMALSATGRAREALPHFAAALRHGSAPALHYNYGCALLEAGQIGAAIAQFSTEVHAQPGFAAARHNLALALVKAGRPAEAVPHYEETLRLVPGSAQVHHNLALALERLDRLGEAISHDEEALRLEPGFAAARHHLARLRAQAARR